MAHRELRVAFSEELQAAVTAGIGDIQRELGVDPGFPAEAEQAAAAAVADVGRILADPNRADRTDLELVTIDPPSARDLDQALHLERMVDGGFRVSYAIADVGAFVRPGDAVDLEAHRRGETLYGGTDKVPLHPAVLSEGAASLLPGQDCPALLWEIELDRQGRLAWEAGGELGVGVSVRRATVRSRAKLDYEGVQAGLDRGAGGVTGPGASTLTLLRELGSLREQLERDRGGVSLPLAEQVIEVDDEGWKLRFRNPLPVEGWNAQISLLTGFSAAALMIAAGVGILRVLPAPRDQDLQALRAVAGGLGLDWPPGMGYPEFIAGLDHEIPRQEAMITAATRLLRGSGYVAFTDGAPVDHVHGALAAPYTHVTAPLRRLIDRYTGEIAVALCAGSPIPEWVLSALATLPEEMRQSTRRSRAYERAVVDLVEAGLLRRRVGETFEGVVVSVDERDPRRGTVVIDDPAIEAGVGSDAPIELGAVVMVRLTSADVRKRQVAFRVDAHTSTSG